MPTGSRNTTTVAPQALLLLNSDLMIDSADAMAGRVLESTAADEGRVQFAYELALGRTPTPSEMERALGFVSGLTSQSLTDAATVDPAAERKAWALLCQSLFASNEFVYVR